MICLYIRHRARACEARSGRVWSPSEASSTMSTSNDRRYQRSTIYINDLRSRMPMMDWSTIVIRAARPSPDLPSRPWNHFFAFQLRLQNWTPFKAPKSSQNRPKNSQNPAPDPSKTAPKQHLILQTPKIKNNATLPRFCSFLTFPGPRKSSQNRCQNAFKISFILDTLLEP